MRVYLVAKGDSWILMDYCISSYKTNSHNNVNFYTCCSAGYKAWKNVHEKIIYRIETNDTISNILINKKTKEDQTKVKINKKWYFFLITIHFIRIKLHWGSLPVRKSSAPQADGLQGFRELTSSRTQSLNTRGRTLAVPGEQLLKLGL